jgi:hypothetical protein
VRVFISYRALYFLGLVQVNILIAHFIAQPNYLFIFLDLHQRKLKPELIINV